MVVVAYGHVLVEVVWHDVGSCSGREFYACVAGGGGLIDEEVVLAALEVELLAEAVVAVEEFLAVGEVTPAAHVGVAAQGHRQVSEREQEVVEREVGKAESFVGCVAAVAQHDVGIGGEIAGHGAEPLVAGRTAIDLGEHEPIVAAGFDA